MMLWREILIGLLFALLAGTTILYDAERGRHLKTIAAWEAQTAIANAARLDVQQRSDEAIKVLTDRHAKIVQEIEANAWTNFKRRFPQYAGCVREPSRPTVSGGTAPSTQAPDDKPPQWLVDFTSACAADAQQVIEWQQWARMNRLPVEGE